MRLLRKRNEDLKFILDKIEDGNWENPGPHHIVDESKPLSPTGNADRPSILDYTSQLKSSTPQPPSEAAPPPVKGPPSSYNKFNPKPADLPVTSFKFSDDELEEDDDFEATSLFAPEI